MRQTPPGRPLVKTKTPGIFRRGSRYVVRARVNGRQVQRAARTMSEARAIRADLLTDPPTATMNHRITLRTYAASWLDGYQGRTGRGVRPETLASYRASLARHILPSVGDWRLSELSPQAIKRLARELSSTLKPSSVRRTLAPLRALLADAYEEGVIRSNPFQAVRLPAKPSQAADERVKALTDAEAEALVHAAPNGADRLLIRLMLATGLRGQEALALRWGDLGPGRLTVQRALSRSGSIGPPKSRAGQRAVPLPPSLVRDLMAYRDGSRWTGVADPLFPDGLGGFRDLKNFANRTFKPAARAAGVNWATPHVLRHTYATRMVRGGWNIKQLQAVLGHATSGITLDTYTHLFDHDLPDALPESGMPGRHTGPPPLLRESI